MDAGCHMVKLCTPLMFAPIDWRTAPIKSPGLELWLLAKLMVLQGLSFGWTGCFTYRTGLPVLNSCSSRLCLLEPGPHNIQNKQAGLNPPVVRFQERFEYLTLARQMLAGEL